MTYEAGFDAQRAEPAGTSATFIWSDGFGAHGATLSPAPRDLDAIEMALFGHLHHGDPKEPAGEENKSKAVPREVRP